MAHITADRVRDTTTTTGTSVVTVSGSAPLYGYQTFSAVCTTNDTFWYCLSHQTASEWEVGLGTYSGANQITRTTVLASSNAGSAVNFSSGTKDAFITMAAAKTLQMDSNGNSSITGALSMGSSFLRNRLINGGFAIDQRNFGASQTITAAAALAYTVDRWYAYCTGANVTGQQVAGSGFAQYGYKFTGATGNTLVGFGQRIEQVNSYDLASGAVTISAYLTASTNTTVTWYLYGPSSTADTFGTIASPTITQIATGTFAATSTRTQFTATISAASMSGFNKGLELRLVAASGLGSGVTLTIDSVQLEPGTIATPFEKKIHGQELSLCQRYYEVTTYDGSTVALMSSPVNAFTYNWHTFNYKVTKRASATFSVVTGSWTGSTPTITAGIDKCSFTSGSLFYLLGTSGNVAASFSAEL